jgi:hypothetical protein
MTVFTAFSFAKHHGDMIVQDVSMTPARLWLEHLDLELYFHIPSVQRTSLLMQSMLIISMLAIYHVD